MLKWLLLMLAAGVLLMLWRLRTFSNRNLPRAGETMPEFRLPDQNGAIHDSADFRGKWLALYFYPKDDTPG